MRRKEREKKLNKSKKGYYLFFALLFVLFIFVSIYFWFKISNLPKYAVVEKDSDGGASVYIVDPSIDKVKRYKVNPDILLTSSNGYGEYKLSSLWELGKKEGLNGKLAMRSIVNNYFVPVYLWKDGNNSNLNLFQKINFKTVLLSNVEYSGEFSSFELKNSILIDFVDNQIQEGGVDIYVEDLTGDPVVIDKLSKIVGVVGTKISGYNKGYDAEFDCEISGGDNYAVEVFSKFLDCNNRIKTEDSKVKIKIGGMYASRF